MWLVFKQLLDLHILHIYFQIQNDNVISQTFASRNRNWLLSKPQSALNCFKNTLLTHSCPIQILKIIQEGFAAKGLYLFSETIFVTSVEIT